MKPSELKSPFDWANRYVVIQDRIWYVPKLCKQADEYLFPGWHHEETFTTEQPICVEYCSGNGTWIAAKALQHKHQNWVAVELKFERVRKIWSKIKNEGLNNLLAVCGEGFETTNRYFLNESVESVFINFPDPWPKTKHAKNRIIQPRFVKEIHRILKPGGILTMVTDDEPYSKIMISELLAAENFESIYSAPYFVHENPGYGQSYFGDLWQGKGKNIYHHAFRKI